MDSIIRLYIAIVDTLKSVLMALPDPRGPWTYKQANAGPPNEFAEASRSQTIVYCCSIGGHRALPRNGKSHAYGCCSHTWNVNPVATS